MYGVDKHGKLYVHVRIWKQDRIFGELVVTEGTVRICCRECLRWHTVKIRQPHEAILEETAKPEEIDNHPRRPLLAGGTA